MDNIPSETREAICENLAREAKSCERYQAGWRELNKFRKEQEFCDVEIECQGKVYSAHKCVLASATPYFKTLFSSPLTTLGDKSRQRVNLSQFSTRNVESLLDFIYGEGVGDDADIAGLLQVAEYVQFDWLVGLLVRAIRWVIDADSCYEWYSIGKACGVQLLINYAKIIMMANYDKIISTRELECSKSVISQIVLGKESPFHKDIILYHKNFSGVYVVDTTTKTITEQFHGPCFMTQAPSSVYSHTDNFRTWLFFAYKRRLFSVSSYDIDGWDESYDPAFEYNTKVQVNCYDFSQQKTETVLKIEPCELASLIYFDNIYSSFMPEREDRPFRLHSFSYNSLNSLYMVFQDDDLFNAIFQLDLLTGKCRKNYIILSSSSKKMTILESKHIGTILLDGWKFLYDLEHFDFDLVTKELKDFREHKQRNNHHAAKDISVTFTWLGSEGTSTRENHFSRKFSKEYEAASLNGEIYMFIVFCNDASKLHVLNLDADKCSWVELFTWSIIGSLDSAFICLDRIYVSITLDSNKGSNIFLVDLDKTILVDVDMVLPPSKDLYQISTIPGYFLL